MVEVTEVAGARMAEVMEVAGVGRVVGPACEIVGQPNCLAAFFILLCLINMYDVIIIYL
jgi:hypothetical protein